MNILITSGGTAIKIDDVRRITNFSTGEFLSRIAEESLLAGHRVIYLHAKRAKKPFENRFLFDPTKPAKLQFSKILRSKDIFSKVKNNIEYVEFQTFDEYVGTLKNILSTKKIDIAFLGAAVSDYGLIPTKGKISSAKNDLILHLTKTNKVIQNVKKWSKKPIFLVGFKLLSGANNKTLVETAYKSGLTNGSDLTIANDLEQIRAGNREIFAVTPEKGILHMTGKDIAKQVVKFATRRAQTTHFKSIVTIDKDILKKYLGEFEQFKAICEIFYKKGMMVPFFEKSHMSHGSLALKVDGGFLITSRGSNKQQLSSDDVVLVRRIDWKKRKIYITSPSTKKASLNAPLMQKIFETFPKINAVVHTHRYYPRTQTTPFAETPGTLEYALAPINLLQKNKLVNLKDHGLISVGENLIEAVQGVLKLENIKGNCYKDFPTYYDLLYKRYLRTVPDFVKLVLHYCGKKSQILDLAAGTGEVTIPLLKHGLRVAALDLNKGMLTVLKKKAPPKYQNKLSLHYKDINKIDFTNKFDIICIRQAINYFIRPSYLDNGLAGIYKGLTNGGKFIFNAPNFHSSTKAYKSTHLAYQEKNITALVTETNTLHKRLLIHRQNALVWKNDEEPMFISDSNKFYMYTKEEFEYALKRAGFKHISFFSGRLKTYNNNDKTLYCVATK